MSTIISRIKAKRLTLLYQITAAICVLGAVAIGILGLPESSANSQLDQVSQSPDTPIPGAKSDQPDQSPADILKFDHIRIDPRSVAARLAMLDNAPQVTTVPDTTPTTEPTDEPTDEPVSDDSGSLAKRVRYTGYINDSDRPLAFIRIDGIQRIVAEGDVALAGSMGLDDLTIKAVRPKFILITDGQVEERIKLASKNGPSISMSSGSDVVVVSVPQREEDVILSPEEIERLGKMSARVRGAEERLLRRQKLGKGPGGFEREPLASFTAGAGNARQKQQQNSND